MRRRTVGLPEDPVLSGMHTGAVQQGQLCPGAARVGRDSQEGGLGGVSSPAARDVSGSRKDWWPVGGLHRFAVPCGRPGALGVRWALLSAGIEPRSCCWAPPRRPPASTCGEGGGRVGAVWGDGAGICSQLREVACAWDPQGKPPALRSTGGPALQSPEACWAHLWPPHVTSGAPARPRATSGWC